MPNSGVSREKSANIDIEYFHMKAPINKFLLFVPPFWLKSASYIGL